MSIKVYNADKSGDYVLIEPSSLQAHLKAGWLLDDPTKTLIQPIGIPPKPGPQEVTKEELAEDLEVLEKMGIEPVYPKSSPKPKRRRGRPRKVKK